MGKTDLTKNSFRQVALLISMYFPPEPGGGATTAWNRALILHKIGYTVFVLCGFPSYPSGRVEEPKYKGKFFYMEKTENFTLIRLRLLPLESRGFLKRFILMLNFIMLTLIWMPRILQISTRIALVYSLAPILFSSFIGYVYSKTTKTFFIYEVSALWPEELVAYRTKLYFIILKLGKILAKISYMLPDMLIVISDLTVEYVTNNYKPKVLIYPLPIGVDHSRYQRKSKESSRKELIEKKIISRDLENKFIVLYAGIISKVTKVDNLLYAANKLKNDTNIVFLVIGEGEEKSRLEEIKLSYNITNLVFLPFQPSMMVPHIIFAADVCVVPLPSEPIYRVTVPTKFFDYLACLKPQIGICVGELAKLIDSNNIGITLNDRIVDKLAEVILTLKNSPSLIKSMELNSHSVLLEYTVDNLAVKFDLVLKKQISIKNKKN
jgi:glycosyltransferase involved in cell wall biosynthesis